MICRATVNESGVAHSFGVNEQLARRILSIEPAQVKEGVVVDVGGKVGSYRAHIGENDGVGRHICSCKDSLASH